MYVTRVRLTTANLPPACKILPHPLRVFLPVCDTIPYRFTAMNSVVVSFLPFDSSEVSIVINGGINVELPLEGLCAFFSGFRCDIENIEIELWLGLGDPVILHNGTYNFANKLFTFDSEEVPTYRYNIELNELVRRIRSAVREQLDSNDDLPF